MRERETKQTTEQRVLQTGGDEKGGRERNILVSFVIDRMKTTE